MGWILLCFQYIFIMLLHLILSYYVFVPYHVCSTSVIITKYMLFASLSDWKFFRSWLLCFYVFHSNVLHKLKLYARHIFRWVRSGITSFNISVNGFCNFPMIVRHESLLMLFALVALERNIFVDAKLLLTKHVWVVKRNFSLRCLQSTK